MTKLKQLLIIIEEISYAGHPDGRETRLELINRYAKQALAALEVNEVAKANDD